MDRLSRENPWIAHGRLSNLVGRGVFVATVADDRIYHLGSDMSDLIISVVLCCAANKSSEDASYRIHRAKLAHVQESMITKALIHANVKGWLAPPEKISNTNRLTRKAPLIERHGETVLQMYQWGLHHGSAWITKKLIADGVEPFGRTGKWSVKSVKKILRSRAVLGHLESKHGIIEGAYERIPGLTDELWLQVQAAQDRRRDAGSAAPFQSKRVNLLAGIGQCARCQGKIRLTEHGTRSYYACHAHVVLGTCDNRCRYRQDLIEVAMLHQFGLGWLESRPWRKALPDAKTLETQLVKLRDREKRLATKLQELDDDELFDVVMGQLRDLRGKVSDTATRLQAARQQAAIQQQSLRIKDVTDRAAIANVLKQQLVSTTFGDDHHVSLTTASGYVLMVIARAGVQEPMKGAWLERVPRPQVAQYPDWLHAKRRT